VFQSTQCKLAIWQTSKWRRHFITFSTFLTSHLKKNVKTRFLILKKKRKNTYSRTMLVTQQKLFLEAFIPSKPPKCLPLDSAVDSFFRLPHLPLLPLRTKNAAVRTLRVGTGPLQQVYYPRSRCISCFVLRISPQSSRSVRGFIQGRNRITTHKFWPATRPDPTRWDELFQPTSIAVEYEHDFDF